MADLTSNAIEAANRAEATALLIRLGYKVYRPEVDENGEDLVVRKLDDALVPVQLKGRMTVDWARYGGKGIAMLFPSEPWQEDAKRDWYLVPHDLLFKKLKQRHGDTKSFAKGTWSNSKPAKWLLGWLAEFELNSPDVDSSL